MNKKEFDNVIQGLIDDGYEYEYIAKRLESSGWKNMKNNPRIENEIYSAVLVEMFNLNGADISFDSENRFIIDSDRDNTFDRAVEIVKKNFKLNKYSPVVPNKKKWTEWNRAKELLSEEDRLKFIAELGDKKMRQKIPELLILLEKEGFNVNYDNLVEFIQSEEGKMFYESIKNK